MARFFLVLFGLILIAPGLCTFGMLVSSMLPGPAISSVAFTPEVWVYAGFIAMVSALLIFFGGLLIRAGLRPRPPEPPR